MIFWERFWKSTWTEWIENAQGRTHRRECNSNATLWKIQPDDTAHKETDYIKNCKIFNFRYACQIILRMHMIVKIPKNIDIRPLSVQKTNDAKVQNIHLLLCKADYSRHCDD